MAKINSLFSVAVILTFIVIVTRSFEHRNTHGVSPPAIRLYSSHYDYNSEVNSNPQNCAELYKNGDRGSGVRKVYPFINTNQNYTAISVYCDHTIDGGGWTVFQHRIDHSKRENFARSWRDYQRGFGDLLEEFWLGLENIHALTTDEENPMVLRVDLKDFDGGKAWAQYDNFVIEDVVGNYRLHLGNYSGTAGNSLRKHDNQVFSTPDNDHTDRNCAKNNEGGWWFFDPGNKGGSWLFDSDCYTAYLNGKPGIDIIWQLNNGLKNRLKFSQMSLRPKNFTLN